jgi:hypothetical protein
MRNFGQTNSVPSARIAMTTQDGEVTQAWYRFFNNLFEFLQAGPGSGTVTSITITAGPGIGVRGGPVTTSGAIEIDNTAPDQTVTLGGDDSIQISGSYPNFALSFNNNSLLGTAPVPTPPVANAAVNFAPAVDLEAMLQQSLRALQVAPAATVAIDPLPRTVAQLPAAGHAGRRLTVTDAVAPVFLSPLTGGGAVVCPAFDNGTAWVAG